jgi:hypothetical protein
MYCNGICRVPLYSPALWMDMPNTVVCQINTIERQNKIREIIPSITSLTDPGSQSVNTSTLMCCPQTRVKAAAKGKSMLCRNPVSSTDPGTGKEKNLLPTKGDNRYCQQQRSTYMTEPVAGCNHKLMVFIKQRSSFKKAVLMLDYFQYNPYAAGYCYLSAYSTLRHIFKCL